MGAKPKTFSGWQKTKGRVCYDRTNPSRYGAVVRVLHDGVRIKAANGQVYAIAFANVGLGRPRWQRVWKFEPKLRRIPIRGIREPKKRQSVFSI